MAWAQFWNSSIPLRCQRTRKTQKSIVRVSRSRQLRVKFTAGLACKLCSPTRCALFTALHNTFHFSLHYILSIASPLVHTSTQSSRARQCSLFLPKFQLVVGQQLATRWHAAEKFSTPTHYYLRGQRRCIAAFFILKSTWSQTSHVISYGSTKINCLHVWCGTICHDFWHKSQLRPLSPPF